MPSIREKFNIKIAVGRALRLSDLEKMVVIGKALLNLEMQFRDYKLQSL